MEVEDPATLINLHPGHLSETDETCAAWPRLEKLAVSIT